MTRRNLLQISAAVPMALAAGTGLAAPLAAEPIVQSAISEPKYTIGLLDAFGRELPLGRQALAFGPAANGVMSATSTGWRNTTTQKLHIYQFTIYKDGVPFFGSCFYNPLIMYPEDGVITSEDGVIASGDAVIATISISLD